MAPGFWKHRSAYARGWLVGYPLFLLVLAGVAGWNPHWGLAGAWDNRAALTVVAMASLLPAAGLMHGWDEQRNGWGFRHVWDAAGDFKDDERDYVGSVLAAESIRAAMTAGLLGMLLNERKHFLGQSKKLVGTQRLDLIIQQPVATMFTIISIVLAASVITTVVALLCYEYATRFAWKESWPKIALLAKAFWLGRIGFYCLMWSLAGLPALLDFRIGFLSFISVFVVMWFYYFFDVPPPPPDEPAPLERHRLILDLELTETERAAAMGWL